MKLRYFQVDLISIKIKENIKQIYIIEICRQEKIKNSYGNGYYVICIFNEGYNQSISSYYHHSIVIYGKN